MIIHQWLQSHPGVVLHVSEVNALQGVTMLRERQFDFIIGRLPPSDWENSLGDDLKIEVSVDDPLVVATGQQSRWARRRKIDLAELMEAEWILTPPDTWSYQPRGHSARGLAVPRPNCSSSCPSAPTVGQWWIRDCYRKLVAAHYGLQCCRSRYRFARDRRYHVEESHLEPGGRALHRAYPQLMRRCVQMHAPLVAITRRAPSACRWCQGLGVAPAEPRSAPAHLSPGIFPASRAKPQDQ
jgi:hypothetical protein